MSNFDVFKSFLQSFGSCNIDSTLCDVSYDKNNQVCLYKQKENNLEVISLDKFCDNVYRGMYFEQSELEKLCKNNNLEPNKFNISSPDAFLIDKEGYWYLIEFKNSKYSSIKASVEKKAYQSFVWLCDLFFSHKKTKDIPEFDFSDPLSFAKKRIKYLLVVSEEKNPDLLLKMHEYKKAKEVFKPYYLEKICHYLFNDASIFTENEFEQEFVNKFKYV